MSKSSLAVLACLGASLLLPAQIAAQSATALAFDGKMPATLAAGREIFRTYERGAVVLQLRSNPVFGSAPENWPVVQVGSLALAFMQENGKGRISIVRGEETELLVNEFALGPDDRARATTEVIVAFDPESGTAVHAVDGNIVALAAPTSSRPVEVSLAAGASAAWTVDVLEVVLVSDAQHGASTAMPRADAAADGISGAVASLGKVLEALRSPVPLPAVRAAENAREPAQIEEKSPAPGYVRLEIATPPSVRRSAGQVRAIVAQSLTP